MVGRRGRWEGWGGGTGGRGGEGQVGGVERSRAQNIQSKFLREGNDKE